MNDILQYKGFYAQVHFSAEDETFFGKLMGINDLVNFEADSVGNLKKAFKEAVDDYLTTCKGAGKSPEKSYKGSFNIRIPSNLHREVALLAAINKMSLNEYVRHALDITIAKERKDFQLEN